MLRKFFLIILIAFITVESIGAAPVSLKNLSEVAVFTTIDPHGAEFYKDYLFIADGSSLLVYNASDPEQPKQAAKFTGFDYPGRVNGLSVSNEQLYVAAGPGWIYVLNISNPEKPGIMYQLTYPNSANDVAVAGNYMYVADSNTGMLIFDLSNRRNPELVGTFYVLRSNISGYFSGWGGISVAVSGNYAFLSGANRQGFYIIDLSDPTMPIEVFHSIGREIYDIAISENDVYLARADGTAQFELLDVSNPYSPEITGSFTILESADRSAIAISGDYIYAASGETWHIFRRPDTRPPQIITQSPREGEMVTAQTVSVSGTAFDRSGIREVLVNGKSSGAEVWSQVITLAEGTNNITITAFDKIGNRITESMQVTYRPAALINISTPVQTPTPTPLQPPPERMNILKNPIFYIIVFALLVVIYWIWTHIRKR